MEKLANGTTAVIADHGNGARATRRARELLRATDAIGAFVSAYRSAVLGYLRSLSEHDLDEVVGTLAAAAATEGNTLYVFGNGGSHAIARHLEDALRRRFMDVRGVRVTSSVDYHLAQSQALAEGYESVFEAVLRAERARAGDLCVVISGSGDSDNLLRAAEYCRARGVRTLSFAGFDGGKISRAGLTDVPFVVRVHDQQISEDIVQSLLHVAVDQAHRRCCGLAGSNAEAVERYGARLERAFDRVLPAFLERVSTDVCRAFLSGHAVYVVAPEGAPLSLCAEHIAHNFNWDAVFQVPNPPRRRLFSTPTSCDYSGIGNDRTRPGIVSCQQLAMAEPGDVVIVYARDLACPAVEHAIAAARRAGTSVQAVAGRAGRTGLPDLDAMVLESDDEDVLADLSQMTGHMLGRVIRMRLMQTIDPDHQIRDMAAYLIGEDLAQRRLIDVVPGL
jgi:phosphoheptose isomerase